MAFIVGIIIFMIVDIIFIKYINSYGKERYGEEEWNRQCNIAHVRFCEKFEVKSLLLTRLGGRGLVTPSYSISAAKQVTSCCIL